MTRLPFRWRLGVGQSASRVKAADAKARAAFAVRAARSRERTPGGPKERGTIGNVD
jgi:hypothetical protein